MRNSSPGARVFWLATDKSQQNRAAVDPWTAVQMFERQEWGRELFETAGPESLANAVVDTVVLVGGHQLGRMWNATGRVSSRRPR
ncbi:MAG: hypothetical protein WEF86_06705 [Gemmatimonadota bacterium]